MKLGFVALFLLLLAIEAATCETMEGVYEMRGKVIATWSGQPLRGADVALFKRDYSPIRAIARGGMDGIPTILAKSKTDENGRFSFRTSVSGYLLVQVRDRSTGATAAVYPKCGEHFLVIRAFRVPSPQSVLRDASLKRH